MAKIGLLVIATGKYSRFLPDLFMSADRYFMIKHNVTKFVFTDNPDVVSNTTVVIPHIHEPWPNPTLKRYHAFNKHFSILKKMDYLFYCDADMLFVDTIGSEILPDTKTEMVATEHPGFYGGRRGTYETNPDSSAYVSDNEGSIYFAGGFNGGTSQAFLQMSTVIQQQIDKDMDKGIIAVWHDESHLNRYLIDNPPKVLTPSYCYPERWTLPFEKKLLALDKDHSSMRY